MSRRRQILAVCYLCQAAIIAGWALAQSVNAAPIQPVASGFFETEVIFPSGDFTLSGTLLSPSSGKSHPAVVLVHGDRPGERAWYRRYAEHFARSGIAALIYDRRGSGRSGGQWLGASFEDFAADAIAAVRFLRQREQIHRDWVGLWGISQGTWVAAIAAANSREVAFLISVSGAGMSPAAQAIWLYENILQSHGEPSGLLSQGRQALRLFFDAVDALQRSGPESVRNKLPGFNLYHDPVPILERLRQPVLAIYGARDASVPPRTSAEIFSAALKRGGNSSVTLLIFPEADHVLTVVGDPEERLAPGFKDAMAEWVRGLVRGDLTFTAPVATLQPTNLPPETVPADRSGWFGSVRVQIVLLVLFGVVFLSPLCAWPVGSLVRRLRGRPSAAGFRAVRGVAALVSVLNLLLLAGLVRLLGGHAAFVITTRYVEQRSFWMVMVSLAFMDTVLTSGLAVAICRALLSGERRWPSQLHCAVVAGAALLFVVFLGSWHLLGF